MNFTIKIPIIPFLTKNTILPCCRKCMSFRVLPWWPGARNTSFLYGPSLLIFKSITWKTNNKKLKFRLKVVTKKLGKCLVGVIDKVRIFWEGQKIWKSLPLKIRRYSVTSNFKWKNFSNFVAFSEYPNFSIRNSFKSKNLKKYDLSLIFTNSGNPWFYQTWYTSNSNNGGEISKGIFNLVTSSKK